MIRRPRLLSAAAAVGALAVAVPASACPPASKPAAPRHVFVINLENKGYATTFGPGSKAPYLSRILRAQGVLLEQYHGTAHNSLPNYLAQISGQGPDPEQQADCQVYSSCLRVGTASHQQAVGRGCVYPASVPTLPGQLTARGLSWKGYMEDMGEDPTRESATCGHPSINTRDNTQQATVKDQYAGRQTDGVRAGDELRGGELLGRCRATHPRRSRPAPTHLRSRISVRPPGSSAPPQCAENVPTADANCGCPVQEPPKGLEQLTTTPGGSASPAAAQQAWSKQVLVPVREQLTDARAAVAKLQDLLRSRRLTTTV